MPAIFVVLTLVLFGAALGRRLLLWSRVPFGPSAPGSWFEGFSFSAGLGLGLFSLVIMAIGLLGEFHEGAVRIGLLIALCLLLPDAVLLVANTVRQIRASDRPSMNWFQSLLVLLILVSLTAGLVSSLAPPTAWDATTSHLKVALRYLEEGAIHRLDDLSSNGPLNSVMLFIPAMVFGGDAAPALLHFAFMVIGGLALLGLSLRYLSRTGAWVAVAAYFLMPIAAVLGSEPVADFALLAYVVLAFAAFVRWWEEERASWLILAAVNLGLAAGTKYTGLHALVILLVGIIVKVLVSRRRPLKLRWHGIAALLVAAVIACPWYVRNAVQTGNPFYPVLANVIPTRHLTSGWKGPFHQMIARREYPPDLLNYVLFPVNYTLGFSRGIERGPVPVGIAYSPGPLFLALVPLVFLLRPVPRCALLAVGGAVCACALILPMHPSPRHLLPFVIPCALAAGYAFDVLSRQAWARWVLCSVVAVVCALQLVPFVGRAATRFQVVCGLESAEQYLVRVDDVYPMAKRAAKTLPRGAKVLYVGERVYYFLKLGVDATMGMPLRQAVVDFPAYTDPAELLDRLLELGYTHVIVNEAILESRNRFALDLLNGLERENLIRLADEKHLILYRTVPNLPIPAPREREP